MDGRTNEANKRASEREESKQTKGAEPSSTNRRDRGEKRAAVGEIGSDKVEK